MKFILIFVERPTILAQRSIRELLILFWVWSVFGGLDIWVNMDTWFKVIFNKFIVYQQK